ncbi:sensor histidine kinase [Thermomonospora catenispora]|uniref:sensor histidine kinase n=1 Tax=Thermomonospora catenispora TaxID=2493090 RepID=UPI001121B32F|nr:histidine kinase [Thermomonospora catenispora]TNY36815.1 two-component sensor histidine kinase [Thermomonospora catenispora]
MRAEATGRRTALDAVHSCGGVLVRTAVRVCGGLFVLGCLLVGGPVPQTPALTAAAAVCLLGAVSVRRLPEWTVAAGASSLAATVVMGLGDPAPAPSMVVELPALLVLTMRAVWRVPMPRVVALAALPAGAALATPGRHSMLAVAVLSAPLMVLVAMAVGTGLYLRALDARRARALADARRDERLALARDLHDFVAHHITGIVVQAQAARYAAGSGAMRDPEQVAEMLGAIERAGTEALTSMRRMVGLLRSDGDASPDGDARGGPVHPADGLERLAELVEKFTDPPAALELDPRVEESGELPVQIAATVHRVVQESLTNVRKHAADATAVRVAVRRRPDGLEVTVHDDGRGGGRRLPGGGFGLVGLTERVQALGGELHAGPDPAGGWRVTAFLPLS